MSMIAQALPGRARFVALLSAVLLPLGASSAAAASQVAPVSSAPASPAAVAPAAAPAPKPATVFVRLETGQGAIVLELEKERAPVTTANFLRYVDAKRFDGEVFYRAMRPAENFGLIQAGVRSDARKLFPAIRVEPTTRTGLTHQTGTISMARSAPVSARSDFFITIGDMSSLDAHPDQPGDNLGFAAFGHVVAGMDVVRAIMAAPTSPTLGAKEGMQGQILLSPVKILSARRIAAPVAPQP